LGGVAAQTAATKKYKKNASSPYWVSVSSYDYHSKFKHGTRGSGILPLYQRLEAAATQLPAVPFKIPGGSGNLKAANFLMPTCLRTTQAVAHPGYYFDSPPTHATQVLKGIHDASPQKINPARSDHRHCAAPFLGWRTPLPLSRLWAAVYSGIALRATMPLLQIMACATRSHDSILKSIIIFGSAP
jgi:hypothetical protein